MCDPNVLNVLYLLAASITTIAVLLFQALTPRKGGWSKWSDWTVCTKGCDGGKRQRHHFCDNPFPAHGGADCPGAREESEDCNTEACPGEDYVMFSRCSINLAFSRIT